MNYASFTSAFDFFASCYVYGCLTYIAILFSLHLYHSLLIDCQALDRSIESVEADFYTQVKDLLNPATEPVIAMKQSLDRSIDFPLDSSFQTA